MTNFSKNIILSFLLISFSMPQFCFGMQKQEGIEINLMKEEVRLLCEASIAYEFFYYNNIICGVVLFEEGRAENFLNYKKNLEKLARQREDMACALAALNRWSDIVQSKYKELKNRQRLKAGGDDYIEPNSMQVESIAFESQLEIPELEIAAQIIFYKRIINISTQGLGSYTRREIIVID